MTIPNDDEPEDQDMTIDLTDATDLRRRLVADHATPELNRRLREAKARKS